MTEDMNSKILPLGNVNYAMLINKKVCQLRSRRETDLKVSAFFDLKTRILFYYFTLIRIVDQLFHWTNFPNFVLKNVRYTHNVLHVLHSSYFNGLTGVFDPQIQK